MENSSAACKGGPTLIFACSGAADVGAVADLAARKLMSEGKGRMYCLNGVGGHVPGILETARSAEKILAIDGCPLDCARLTLEHAGFTDYRHVRVTDHGMKKGQTQVTDQAVAAIAVVGEDKLSI